MNEILRNVDKNHDCSYSSIYRLPLEFRKAVQHEKTRMMESLTIKLSPEWLFSEYRNIFDEKRAKLLPTTGEKLLCSSSQFEAFGLKHQLVVMDFH